jgi:hypothetical protein
MRSSGAGCVTARIVSLSSSRFINVARFDTGNCPAADKDGTALSDTRLGNEDGPPISCFYAKNVCEYFAEVLHALSILPNIVLIGSTGSSLSRRLRRHLPRQPRGRHFICVVSPIQFNINDSLLTRLIQ